MRSLSLAVCVTMLVPACSASHHGATETAAPRQTPAAAALRAVAETAWVRLPAPRTRAAALVAGNIYVAGGLVGGSSTASVITIDASGPGKPAGTLAEPVHDAAGALVHGLPRVFGGGRVGSTDAVQTIPGAITAHLPEPRSDLAAVGIGGSAYILGGFDGTRLPLDILFTQDATRFDTVGRLAAGVRYPAVALLGNAIYAIGGSTATTESSATGQVDLVQRFDLDGHTTSVAAHLPHALAHASAFVLDGALFVAGGVDGRRPLTDIYSIEPSTGAVRVAGSLPGPRSDAAVVVVAHTAWLIGGENGGPTAPLDSIVWIHTQR